MKMNDRYYICVFESRNMAIYVYSILEKLGYSKFKLVSTPCQIKYAGCSYSIRFNDIAYIDILKEQSNKIGAKIKDFYLVERKNGKRVIKKVSI